MWIKTSERMPEPGERVLMCFDGSTVFEGFIRKDGKWQRGVYSVDFAFGKDTTVTHWQPLPAPPTAAPTNGDVLRAKSDEALAKELIQEYDDPNVFITPDGEEFEIEAHAIAHTVAWLNATAEGG